MVFWVWRKWCHFATLCYCMLCDIMLHHVTSGICGIMAKKIPPQVPPEVEFIQLTYGSAFMKLHKETVTDTIWYCSPGPGSLVVILQSTTVKIPLQWNFDVNVSASQINNCLNSKCVHNSKKWQCQSSFFLALIFIQAYTAQHGH